MSEVISRTPLILKPIHSRQNLSQNRKNITNSVDHASGGGHFQANLVSVLKFDEAQAPKFKVDTVSGIPLASVDEILDKVEQPELETLARNLTDTLETPKDEGMLGTISASNSTDVLSASPIFGYSSFDVQSLDSLATPDEFVPIDFRHGLTNINYDFDFSDNSAENSVAEDVGGDVKCSLPASRSDLEEFDPLLAREAEEMPPKDLKIADQRQIEGEKMQRSIIDGGDSPNEILLPSPLKPIAPDYKGFTKQGQNIPTISCNTGDFGAHSSKQ